MGHISLDFRNDITPAKINKLKNVATDMEAGKDLSITLERTAAHEADNIIRILQNHNYKCHTKGGHKDEFYIKAKKF